MSEKTIEKKLNLQIFDLKGEKTASKALESTVFGVDENPALIAQAVRVNLANKRNVVASTKDRSEVAGGGRKPWKQKGTGNARAGSNRSPLWIGGGITFGPNNLRNFKLKMAQKMTKAALRVALSAKARENKIVAINEIKFEKISTKEAAGLLKRLPLEGKILIILDKSEPNFELSVANLPFVKVLKSTNINVYDLLYSDSILVTVLAIEKLQQQFKGKE